MHPPTARVVGGSLIAATVVFLAGASLGFFAPGLRDDPPFVADGFAEAAPAIASNPAAWRWANGLILAAALVTAIALVPVALRATRVARVWCWGGVLVYAFSASLRATDRLIAIQVFPPAAGRYPDPDALERGAAFWPVAQALGRSASIIGFIAVGLLGLGFARAGRESFARALLGAAVAGLALEIIGVGIPAFLFFATAGLGAGLLAREPDAGV